MSGLPRHAKKRDANEAGIIDVLEAVGRVVIAIDRPVDLIVESRCECGRKGWTLMEVKNPKGKNTTTADQETFLQMCWEKDLPVVVVRNDMDALEAVK